MTTIRVIPTIVIPLFRGGKGAGGGLAGLILALIAAWAWFTSDPDYRTTDEAELEFEFRRTHRPMTTPPIEREPAQGPAPPGTTSGDIPRLPATGTASTATTPGRVHLHDLGTTSNGTG